METMIEKLIEEAVVFLACTGFATWVLVLIVLSSVIHHPGGSKARREERKGTSR